MTDPKDWPKNRELWIAALRDPKRRQIRGVLGHQDNDGQCCLGVLAEIAGCTPKIGIEAALWDGERTDVPSRAINFVGLRRGDGEYFSGDRSLVEDNDERGKTFAEIADIIESEPEGLFRP